MEYIIIFLISVLISSISQTILKASANESHENSWREYLNIKVIFAYFLFFFSSFITIFAYKKVSLSLGPVLEASGYIFVTVLGVIFLKEKVGRKKLAGLAMILLGIAVFNLWPEIIEIMFLVDEGKYLWKKDNI